MNDDNKDECTICGEKLESELIVVVNDNHSLCPFCIANIDKISIDEDLY